MKNIYVRNAIRLLLHQPQLLNDPGIRALMSINLQIGDLVIDCGANIGNTVNLVTRRGVEVHAFEPNRHAFEILNKKFKHKREVHCHHKAVSDQDGWMKLFYHINADDDEVKFSTGSSLVADKPNVNKNKYEEVESIDLSKFINSLTRTVKILKIDIEGAEIQVLEEMIKDQTLHRVENLFVEFHDRKMPHLTEASMRLRQQLGKFESLNIVDWR